MAVPAQYRRWGSNSLGRVRITIRLAIARMGPALLYRRVERRLTAVRADRLLLIGRCTDSRSEPKSTSSSRQAAPSPSTYSESNNGQRLAVILYLRQGARFARAAGLAGFALLDSGDCGRRLRHWH